MSKKTIEERAREYALKELETVGCGGFKDCIRDYTVGATEQKAIMLEEASKGFEEWNGFDKDSWGYEISNEAWQASTLSAMKTPETFDPEIPAERYHIWCKHHQRVSELDAEKLHRVEKDLKLALDALQRESDENEILREKIIEAIYSVMPFITGWEQAYNNYEETNSGKLIREFLKELDAATPSSSESKRQDTEEE